jgi:RNA polymerase sigma-70 factor, ECF subfamily
LPPICRQVFLLSRYEYKSYSEIAGLLNISVNTVEKHIGKALSILRNALHQKGA